MSDEMHPGDETAGDGDGDTVDVLTDAADDAGSGAPAEEGGIDLRLIVLLVVLAPFVIAMVLGLLERFKAGQVPGADVAADLEGAAADVDEAEATIA